MDGIICTRSGIAFDIFDPHPEMVSILDIAHALGATARFGGHTQPFYSVAEHSINVMRLMPDKLSNHVKRMALLHDAAEAYVGDIPRPIKNRVPALREAERRIMAAVNTRFGLEGSTLAIWQETVYAADDHMLSIEADQLMPAPQWWTDVNRTRDAEPLECWSPSRARIEFLDVAEQLGIDLEAHAFG